MSRKALKAINWAALAEKIPETEKQMFVAFKANSDQFLRRMMANPETAPKINWDYYKKNIRVSGLVDKFQKEYESLSIPYPEDKYTNQIDAEQKEMESKMQNFIEETNKVIQSCKAELEEQKNMLPYSEMTMEDLKDYHPETAYDWNNPTIWPHTPEFQHPVDLRNLKFDSH